MNPALSHPSQPQPMFHRQTLQLISPWFYITLIALLIALDLRDYLSWIVKNLLPAAILDSISPLTNFC
jgi:hypothetical protein